MAREERFQAPEILFRPQFYDREGVSIAESLLDCIQSCAMDTRASLYKHIVLSGGTTCLTGFKARLEDELKGVYVARVLNGDRTNPNVHLFLCLSLNTNTHTLSLSYTQETQNQNI